MTTLVFVLARALHIGSAMMLVALPYFVLVVWRPVFTDESDDAHAPFYRGTIRWLGMFWLLEVLSGAVWYWFVTAQMSGQSPWQILDADDLSTVLWQTQFGRLWLWRTFLGAALAVALFILSRRKFPPRLGSTLVYGLILVLAASLLVTLAWAGHAASGQHDHVLHLFADTFHLLLGALWPMGLIPLVAFLRYFHRDHPGPPSDREIAALRRFSRISGWAVLILVATGIINGWLMIGSWTAVVTTLYGRLLLGKVFVVAVMIAFGAVNRFRLLPKMTDDPDLFPILRRNILTESALALVVLLIVGLMGMTAPPA